MRAAIAAAAEVRTNTAPNPWVGAIVVSGDGTIIATGATQPPGGPHAERVALAAAGEGGARRDAGVARSSRVATTGPPPCVDGDHRRRDRPRRGRHEGSRRPRRRRRGSSPCGPSAWRSPSGSRPRRSTSSWRPTLTSPHRAALRRAQAGGHRRRSHRRARRHQPVDHRGRARADAHRLRAESERPSSSVPAPCGPTIRR